METITLKVEGMACEHCVRAVKNAAGTLSGVSGITVDLAAGLVTVEYDPAQTPLDGIKAAIEEEGYEIVG